MCTYIYIERERGRGRDRYVVPVRVHRIQGFQGHVPMNATGVKRKRGPERT